MNSLWDIRIFLGLAPKESHCIMTASSWAERWVLPAVKFACCLCCRKCGTWIYRSATCLKTETVAEPAACYRQRDVQHTLHVFITVLRHIVCVISRRVFLQNITVIHKTSFELKDILYLFTIWPTIAQLYQTQWHGCARHGARRQSLSRWRHDVRKRQTSIDMLFMKQGM